MQKLILVSILVLTVAAPALAVRDPHGRRSLRKVIVWMLAGVCAYVFAVIFLYPRFNP